MVDTGPSRAPLGENSAESIKIFPRSPLISLYLLQGFLVAGLSKDEEYVTISNKTDVKRENQSATRG
jgi:hypothetical protein